MTESWAFDDGAPAPASSETVLDTLRARFDSGRLETWWTSSTGRSLAFVTNTERAMVVLLQGEGDPGEHAVDPQAEGSSDGFVLSTGQHDGYPDQDTVRIGEAFRLVEYIVSTGSGLLTRPGWPTADTAVHGGDSPLWRS